MTDNTDKLNGSVDFLYEIGQLCRTPRSGFSLLLGGKQDVSQHTLRTVFITLIMTKSVAQKHKPIDHYKAMTMALFHDANETRISDLNHLNQLYNRRQETKASNDQLDQLSFGGEIKKLLKEYRQQKTREAKIVKDADSLELLITINEQLPENMQAKNWQDEITANLKTETGQELARQIRRIEPSRWWAKLEHLH